MSHENGTKGMQAADEPNTSPPRSHLETHFSPKDLASRWGVSTHTVRALFANEPGVLRIDRREERNKRGYCSIRIPESMARAIYLKHTNPIG